MNIDATDLRKGDRFTCTATVQGTFGPAEVIVINLSVTGAQFTHAHPLRIGTKGRFVFRHGEVSANIPAHVVWSHLVRKPEGLAYTSGIRMDAEDASYAAALAALFRAGAIRQDTESLQKKRDQLLERERARIEKLKRMPPPIG